MDAFWQLADIHNWTFYNLHMVKKVISILLIASALLIEAPASSRAAGPD